MRITNTVVVVLAGALAFFAVLGLSPPVHAAFDGDELPRTLAWLGTVPLGIVQLVIGAVARKRLKRSAAPWTILASLAAFGLALLVMGLGSRVVKIVCFLPGVPLLVLWSDALHRRVVGLLVFAAPPLLPLLLILSIA